MSRSYATRLQDFVSVVRDLIAGAPVIGAADHEIIAARRLS
jgi:hypothetical protein